MASIAPSQLFCYKNKAVLDELALNACDSEGNWRKPRIPAELLYEPFQQFLRDAHIPLVSVDDPRFYIPHNSPVDKQKFMKDVLTLVECVAARYTLEEDLSDRLNNIFSSLLGVSVRRRLTPRARGDREGNADGAYEATGIGQDSAFVLIREDKLGTGSGGGDSLVELFGHYTNILNFSNMPPPAPVVLVEVLGQRLIVSLAACDDMTRPTASPAVVSHNLIIKANPTGQIAALAGSVLALRQLVTTITLQKNNLPPPLLSEDNRFGYNLVFRTPEKNNGFHKFLRSNESYGFDVHAWCSARGFAPEFNLVEMTSWWRCVEMSNPGDREWSMAHSIHDDARLRERVLAAVRNVVGQMHDQGFVHGDLRAANTLYCVAAETTMTESEEDDDEVSVLLIDFNSSGRVGTARYAFLPFRIAYAPEAVPGGLVTTEHDRWRLETVERFFS